MFNILAQGTAVAVSSLDPLYYGLGIVALIISGLWALKRYADQQRRQNILQGNSEQRLADKLDAVVTATEKNTKSIDCLSGKFDKFSSDMDKRLTLTDYRVSRLENPNGTRKEREFTD